MSFRLALGQVLDYGRYVKQEVPAMRLAVLLPDRPTDNLIELLQDHEIGCVVQTSPDVFNDTTLLGYCPRKIPPQTKVPSLRSLWRTALSESPSREANRFEHRLKRGLGQTAKFGLSTSCKRDRFVDGARSAMSSLAPTGRIGTKSGPWIKPMTRRGEVSK
jgi:hypothetical protein